MTMSPFNNRNHEGDFGIPLPSLTEGWAISPGSRVGGGEGVLPLQRKVPTGFRDWLPLGAVLSQGGHSGLNRYPLPNGRAEWKR